MIYSGFDKNPLFILFFNLIVTAHPAHTQRTPSAHPAHTHRTPTARAYILNKVKRYQKKY